MEDARDVLFSRLCNEDDFRGLVCTWLHDRSVIAYHGSRLDDAEVQNIRKTGLRILSVADRRAPLIKKLELHPRWPIVVADLDSVLRRLGSGNYAGNREGQTHATISRNGLVKQFNHYLTYGAEFDQRAANILLGDEGKPLLARYGRPMLVVLGIPGKVALDAANVYRYSTNGLPNIISEIAAMWSYWLVHPRRAQRQDCDCGLIFNTNIGPEWIRTIEEIDPRELASGPG